MYLKDKSYKNPEILKRLYWVKNLSTTDIGKRFDVSDETIRYWMKKHKIPRRYSKRVKVSKELLEDIYIRKKLSIVKTAKKLNTTYKTIWKKLRKFGIKARTISEANIKYPKPHFSGDLTEMAYMLGLRVGDVSSRMNGKQIMVYTSTTHPAQLQMFKDTFDKYTHRIYSYIGTTPKKGIAWKVSCLLHESFNFLLNKFSEIPEWILQNDKLFYSFLAGYSDCEANWDIGKQPESKKIRLRFRIKSGDKVVLEQISNKLKDLKFRPCFYPVKKTGKKDMYCLGLFHKSDVIRLSKIMVKLSDHLEKIWKMKLILEVHNKRWEEVKDKIFRLRKKIRESRLNSSNSGLSSVPRIPGSNLY